MSVLLITETYATTNEGLWKYFSSYIQQNEFKNVKDVSDYESHEKDYKRLKIQINSPTLETAYMQSVYIQPIIHGVFTKSLYN